MKLSATALAAALALTPAAYAKDDGLSLMEQGARLFLKGIMTEVEPALKDLKGLSKDIEPALRLLTKEMGTALVDILSKIDDIAAYHPPEMLPNGDIIMRRKVPKVPAPKRPAPDSQSGSAPKPGETDI